MEIFVMSQQGKSIDLEAEKLKINIQELEENKVRQEKHIQNLIEEKER